MPGGRPRKNGATDARQPDTTAANVGYEAQLWQMADALRGNMDAAEYKHVVLGLIFLKYISDAFEEQHAELEAERAQGADPEDPDEYRAENIFWVPQEARWSHLKANAKQPTIGKLVDDAMVGHRARQSRAQGRAAQGLRPPGARQAAPRRAHRPDRHHRRSATQASRSQGHARPRLRILPRAVRQRRGQEGRRVLHAALRRASCWSRCSRPTRAASTTRAAAPAACSCSREKFVEGTQRRQGVGRHLASTARSRTPPPGGWPR